MYSTSFESSYDVHTYHCNRKKGSFWMERGRGRLRGKETFQMFSSFTAAAALFLIYNSLMGLSWTEKHEKKSYHQRRHSAAVAPSNLYYYYYHLLSNSSLLPFFLRNCAWKTANLGKIEGEDREQTKNLLRDKGKLLEWKKMLLLLPAAA